MNYVIAGYSIVLTILFLYGLHLLWRRRRLIRTAAQVASYRAAPDPRPDPPMTTAPPIDPAASSPSGPDDGGGRPPGPPRPAAPMPTSHRLRYTVVGLVLVGALAFLLVKGLSSALDFYLPANQAVAEKATLGSRTINLEGLVAPHSIHATPKGVDFVMTSGATRVQVLNSSSPPQLFQPNIPVIAVGHFSGSHFVSDQILVKHSSTYIAAHPGRVTAPNGSKR